MAANSSVQLYPKETIASLEFDKLIEILHENCLSPLGQQAIREQAFSANIEELNFNLKQVAEMKSALENGLRFPAQNYHDLSEEIKPLKTINNIIDGKQVR